MLSSLFEGLAEFGGALVGGLVLLAIVCKVSHSFSHWLFGTMWSRMCVHVNAMMRRKKEKLFEESVRGDVLEIGSGTAINLEYYSRLYSDRINSVTFVEPNPHLFKRAVKRIEVEGPAFAVHNLNEYYPTPKVAEEQYDTIVCTLVLCTVADLEGTVRELHRQLRPGGRLLLIEHISPSPHTLTHFFARLAGPMWTSLGDGCQLLRDTDKVVKSLPWTRTNLSIYNTKMNPLIFIAKLAARTLYGYAEK
eukprot:m.181082 g.181082  ORF g.181082 m.181082 type:complete len:249 (+) comp13582_c0_seq8:116-862(+)